MKGLCHTCIHRSEPTKIEHRFGRGDSYAYVNHVCASKRKRHYFKCRAASKCKYYKEVKG